MSSLLIGCLVDAGQLRGSGQLGVLLSNTLGEIFPMSDGEWAQVGNATEKKAMTLHELLTMESGLEDVQANTAQDRAQDNLVEVLNSAVYNPGTLAVRL